MTVFSDYRYPLKPQNQDFCLVPVHVARASVRGWLAEAYASDGEGVDSNNGASQLSYHRWAAQVLAKVMMRKRPFS